MKSKFKIVLPLLIVTLFAATSCNGSTSSASRQESGNVAIYVKQ